MATTLSSWQQLIPRLPGQRQLNVRAYFGRPCAARLAFRSLIKLILLPNS